MSLVLPFATGVELRLGLLSFVYLLAALVVLAGAVQVYLDQRNNRATALLIAFSACFFVWTLLRAASVANSVPEQVIAIARMGYAFVFLSTPLIFWFISLVMDDEASNLALIRVNFVVAAFMALAAVGTPWVINGWHQRPWSIEASWAPFAAFGVLWHTALVCVTGLSIWRQRKLTRIHSKGRRRLNLLCWGWLAIVFGSLNVLPNWAALPDYLYWLCLPLGLPTFTLLTVYLNRKFWLTSISAPLAAQQIADLFEGVVIVLDDTGIVRYANERCEEILGLKPDALKNRTAESVLGPQFSVANMQALALSKAQSAEAEMSWPHRTTGQLRELRLSAMSVQDHRERNTAMVCMASDVTEIKAQELNQLDPLTLLPQRNYFLAQLDRASKECTAGDDAFFAVCCIGVARMRVINEDLGLEVGDQVLVETARRIQGQLRPQDLVARVGGDEFGVLLAAPLDHQLARELILNVREATQAPIALADHSLHPKVNIGLVKGTAADHGAPLLRTAGQGMQRAKLSGRRVEVVRQKVDDGSATLLELELRRALTNDELQPFYQPIINLQSQRIVGFEALIRWQHPQRGLLLPGAFIERAEKAGLIAQIDARMLGKACRDLRRLQLASADAELSMSVNLDGSLLAQPDLLVLVEQAISESGIAAHCLCIEVLEQVLLESGLQAVLQALRTLGVGLYIDDFGTGYSSLSRLHQLPVTAFKIDRDFVTGMPGSESSRKVVKNLIGLGANLGLPAIAEGVGNLEELQAVEAAGCHLVQGFHYSKAVPLVQAMRLLQMSVAELTLHAEVAGQ